VQAHALVWVTRLSLWLLPYARVQALLATLPVCMPRHAPLPGRIAWAVHVVSRTVPVATCLTQALVVQRFLQHWQYAHTLQIGVARDARGGLAAHAWIEMDGRMLIGGAMARGFTPLTRRETV
jgi:hypothetical protein